MFESANHSDGSFVTAGYDVFVSYAQSDNLGGEIDEFLGALSRKHLELFPEKPLAFFQDKRAIRTADDWRHRIHDCLRSSQLFVAIVSPGYFQSDWCRREWQAWIDHEIACQTLGETAFPIYLIEIPALTGGMTEAAVAAELVNLDELNARARRCHFQQITRRQFLEVRPFFPEGLDAMRRGALAETLANLAQGFYAKQQMVRAARQTRSTVPPYNKRFVGRLEELQKLRQFLGGDKAGIIASVQGLGGIGKTELAFAYAQAYALRYPGGRFLIQCEHLQDLRLAIVQLDPQFPGSATDEQRKSLDQHFRAICEAIRNRLDNQGAILLVLDNVTNLEVLSPEQTDRIRALGAKLHILATSRCEMIVPDGASDYLEFVPIEELDSDESLLLLESHRPLESERDKIAAELIVHRLGGFPLAVELFGAYLAQQPEVTYESALKELGVDELQGVDLVAERANPVIRRHNHEKRLTSVLGPTLALLNEMERKALSFAGLLPADNVALPWLRVLTAQQWPTLSDSDWKGVVHRLLAFSLITRGVDDDGDIKIVRCHRLVQRLVSGEPAKVEKREAAIGDFVDRRIAELQQTKQWKSARWELSPLHSLSLLWEEKGRSATPNLMRRVGKLWYELAEWSQSEILMRRALSIDEMTVGQDHPDVAVDLNNVANVLMATNRLNEAERMLRRAVAINDVSLNDQDPVAAIAFVNLAYVLKLSNRTCEAEELLDRAIRVYEADPDSYSPELATALNNLAEILKATNRPTEAASLLRRALALNESTFGPDHPNVAAQLNNLAEIYRELHQLEEAEPLLKRSLQIVESTYGMQHPQVAIALSNLGDLVRQLNRPVEAEALIRKALQIAETSQGPNHPMVGISLGALAGLLQATNRRETEPLLRRALAIFEASFGSDHPRVAEALNNLATLLQHQGRLTEAESLLRRALTIFQMGNRVNDPQIASTLNNLAILFFETNRVAEAEPLLLRALQIDEGNLGPDHPSVAIRLNNVANVLKATARHSEAEPLLRRAVTVIERTKPAGHPDIGNALLNLAHLLQITGRLTEAEPLLRRAVRIFEESLGKDHPNLAIALNNLAQLLEMTGQDAEAESLMQRALAIDEVSLGSWHPNLAIHLNNLGGLLRKSRRLPEAELLLRRAVHIMLRFTKANGLFHPNLRLSLRNYRTVVMESRGSHAVRTCLGSLIEESQISADIWQRIHKYAFD